MKGIQALVYEIDYDHASLTDFVEKINGQSSKYAELLLEYPTVYVVSDPIDTKNYSVYGAPKYTVYVGETTDISRRTQEHLQRDSVIREDWKDFNESETAKMYLIGHPYFNKSLTLDIENRLMLYLLSVENIKTVNNRRVNPQNKYYTSDRLDQVFSSVWRELRKKNEELFPLERIIRDSAIFKASPFHKLSEEQLRTKEFILSKIKSSLRKNKTGQLILVAGEAGSGKTVLMSSLFYDLFEESNSNDSYDENVLRGTKNYLLVNHDQQLKVYQQIAQKLGMIDQSHVDIISKPTKFINHCKENEMADIVVVDEAHLLWTQGKQSYRGKNQLYDLLNNAKVVVAVFDENQILTREQVWEKSEMKNLLEKTSQLENCVYLKNQLRINADRRTVEWIRNLIDTGEINPIPQDSKGYELKVFDTPMELHQAIIEKSKNTESGLSRLIATFDWEYVDKTKPKDSEYWEVKIGEWRLPWNLQLPQNQEQKIKSKYLAWAEQEQTIDEVGSTFTIQGFDLNYAGVIIGPSVKYRNNRIIFDREASKNKKATQKRTLKNGKKEYFSDTLLKNELNVLLTRGVNGLYIYAVDEELQNALKKAQG